MVETYAWNSTVKTVIVTNNERGGGGGEGKRGLIKSYAFHELRIKYLRFRACSKIKVVQNVKKRNVSPILWNRVLRLYFSKLTRILRTLWKTLHGYKFSREAIDGSERTEVWSYIKRLES